ncbi:hypothetical protein KEM56_002458 [Ascosphaera pollenicola]|nr:hypothetical protein KEM56_002458 [Ascosphaera pollenicola]
MGVYVPFTGHDDLQGLAHENPVQIDAPLTAFLAVALNNSIELLVLIYITFSQYNSLYFWSLLCTTFFGVFCSALGYVFYYFEIITSAAFFTATFPITWMFLVTVVVEILTYTERGHNEHFVHAYSILERIEITWFTVQETIISVVYICYTFRLLSGTRIRGRRTVFYQLILINVIEIAMNLALIILQYLDIYLVQTILKITVYSIKLKLEFAVLGQIVKISQVKTEGQIPDFVDVGQSPPESSLCSEPSSPTSERKRKESWFSEHFFPLIKR